MRPLTEEQRQALGLAPDTPIEVEGRDLPRDSGVGLGFSASTKVSDADLKYFQTSMSEVGAFRATAERLGAPEASLARSDLASWLFILTPGNLSVDAVGAAVDRIDCWVIDARAEDVRVVLSGPSGQALLSFDGPTVEWGRVAPMASAELRSLSAWAPPERPTIASPGADALLGGFEAPSWLTAPLDPSLRLDAFAVVAAVGTLGRLWSPRGTRTPVAEAMARVRAHDDPLARAIAWARTLPAEVCVAAEELSRLEVDALAGSLESLSVGTADDLALSREDARAWLERRDDLASVATLLGALGRGAPLRAWLDSLDRHARTHATTLGALAPIDSPRLGAVAWQEPDAWWAAYSEAP